MPTRLTMIDVLAEEHNLRMAERVAYYLRVDYLRTATVPPFSYNAWQETYLAQVTADLHEKWPF